MAARLPKAKPIMADITREADCTSMIEVARVAYGPIDIVVANAGLAESAPAAKINLEHWRRVIDVNLTGALLTVKAALADVTRAEAKAVRRIVFVASTASLKGYPYIAAYCAAKHGVVGLMRALSAELLGKGVTVNAICPGYTETPLLETAVGNISSLTGSSAVDARAELAKNNAHGRLISPEEIAQAVKEELTGANTGYDIIGMLSNTVMKSTYRAGVMREHALEELRELELKHGAGIAFEILGPPRLSKLLFEAETLRRTFGTLSAIAKADPARMSARLADLVKKDAELRSRVVSIGIPILLPDGVSLLRGPRVAIPAWRGADRVRLTAATRDRCAHDGWVDLRETNMRLWIARAKGLTAEIATGKESRRGSDIATSSRTHRKRYEVTRDGKREMNIGEIVGWIFNEEE
ncbi:MAG: SDR family oxidoreductase, partial [Sphingopyxis terrae]